MTDQFLYLGINRDGFAVAAVVDDPKFRNDTARTVGQWIRDGLAVERFPSGEGWKRLKADREARKAARTQAEDVWLFQLKEQFAPLGIEIRREGTWTFMRYFAVPAETCERVYLEAAE